MRVEHWLYTIPLRLRALFRRRRVEQDLDDELQYHLERKIEEHRAGGLSPEKARQAALRDMDGLTQRKEECRDMRRLNVIDHLLQDLRYGLRVLAKSPGFTTVAVLTMALAIGANSVVFGILNALILRPLDVPRAESLYALQRSDEGYSGASYPDYLDMRDRNRSFESLAAYGFSEASLDTGGNPVRSWGVLVTGNYFETLGIQPHLGRLIQPSDEHGFNSAPYLVLSYIYWQTRFSGDPGVIGQAIRVNKHPYTIIGVAPPGFHGTLLFFYPDFFAPLVNAGQLEEVNTLPARGVRSVFMVMGHLKAGVAHAQAVADLTAIASDLAAAYPKECVAVTFKLVRPGLYGDYLGRPVLAFVGGLMLFAGLILFAACANLGNLFAARAADRGREVAVRLALGASRNRILRQLLTEAVMISTAGGALGLAGSVALLRALSTWRPVPRFPIHVPVHPDANVYWVALALALASGLLFGIVPVRQVLRTDPYRVIKAGPGAMIGRRTSVRDLLLAAQVAVCAVLVTSSIVAVRGLVRSLQATYGFEPRNVLLLSTVLDMAGYRGDQSAAMQKRMIEALQTIPGVESVAAANTPPLSQMVVNSAVYTEETAEPGPSNIAARPATFNVSPDYFRAAGTALLSGRSLTCHDDANAPRVAVVNREFARKLFGSADGAVGRRFKLRSGARIEVVGIAQDGKYRSLAETNQPALFVPILQSPVGDTCLIVRATRDPAQLAPAARARLRDLDTALPLYISTWSKELDGALFTARVATVALGVMGLMGAMLAVTGIFGMAAYSVSRRLRELGIRMALGAARREVLQAGLGRVLKLLALGSAAGLILGVLSTRILSSIVYQATPRDPVVLAGAVLVMALLGLAAAWIPARRALSLDPMRLLREE